MKGWLLGVEGLRQALRRRPTSPELRDQLARRCLGLGNHFLERGRHEEARPWLLEAGKQDPEGGPTSRLAEEALKKLPAASRPGGSAAATSPPRNP